MKLLLRRIDYIPEGEEICWKNGLEHVRSVPSKMVFRKFAWTAGPNGSLPRRKKWRISRRECCACRTSKVSLRQYEEFSRRLELRSLLGPLCGNGHNVWCKR